MFNFGGKFLLTVLLTATFSANAAVVNSSVAYKDNNSDVWSEVSQNMSDLNALMNHCSNPMEENGVYIVALDLMAAKVSSTDVQAKVVKSGKIDTLVILVSQNTKNGVNVMSSSITLPKPVNERELSTRIEDGILLIMVPITRSAQLENVAENYKVLPELRKAQAKMQQLLNRGVVWDTSGWVRGTPVNATIAQIDVNGISYTRSTSAYDYNIVVNSPSELVIYDSQSNQKIITEKNDEMPFKTYLIGSDKDLAQYYKVGSQEINGNRCTMFKSDIEGGELCISDEWGIPIYRKNSFWRYEQTISNIGVDGVKMKWFDIPSDAVAAR